ncbi:UNVERIFIED_CONTAM: hypothetical protein K2H54_044079 [Gekko kuhli]
MLRALYNYQYEAEDGRWVTIVEGELFQLLRKANVDWWQVQRLGQTKERRPIFVPASYVAEVPPGTREARQPNVTSHLRVGMGQDDGTAHVEMLYYLEDLCKPPHPKTGLVSSHSLSLPAMRSCSRSLASISDLSQAVSTDVEQAGESQGRNSSEKKLAKAFFRTTSLFALSLIGRRREAAFTHRMWASLEDGLSLLRVCLFAPRLTKHRLQAMLDDTPRSPAVETLPVYCSLEETKQLASMLPQPS